MWAARCSYVLARRHQEERQLRGDPGCSSGWPRPQGAPVFAQGFDLARRHDG